MDCRSRKVAERPSMICFLLGLLLSQNVAIPVLSAVAVEEEGSVGQMIDDEKAYYTPTPGGWEDNKCNGGHHGTGAPHHTNPPVNCGTPPSGSYGSPTPRSGGSGGYYHSPPTTGGHPGSGGSVTPPSTGGSGGYYNTPPSTGGGGSTPTYTPPSTGSGGSTPLLPSPTTPTGPTFPLDPGTPFVFGTCGWWIGHPAAIYGLLGYIGTVGGIFGAICTPIFGHDLTIPQALANSRPDGLGSLFREGTASLLNSMATRHFPFTTEEVRNSFTAALFSNEAAAAQADIFQQANEGRLKPRE